MERCPHPAKVRPLGHRLQVIDRFPGLDLDDPLEPAPLVGGGQDQVREHLTRADAHGHGLLVARIDGNLVLPLQFRLQQTDDAVMLELLSNRSNQNRTHVASGEPGMLTQFTRRYPAA